jgi:transcriptional regulator with XRE-family HTH domain
MSKELVKNIMDARSWKLSDMAEHFGVDHSTAWRWLNKGPSSKGVTLRLLEQEWKKIEKAKGK